MSILHITDKIYHSEQKNIVSRERLLTQLDNNKDKNVILIQTPAGYGKTNLVMDFLNKSGIRASWLNSTVEMNHLYTFIHNFVHAFKLIDPGFGNNTLQLLESRREKLQLGKNERVAAIELCSTFLNEFKTHFENDVYIVIDDFHNIDESLWLNTFFDKLLENLPENIHIFIISRQIPDFDFIHLAISDKILRLETKDFIFRNEEINQLLKNVYSIEPDEDKVKILAENIGGWITGIHMLLQTYGKDFDKLELQSQKIPENIFNFLAEEIFKSLDIECQSFLLNTSFLENFSEDICNYLQETQDSERIFKILLNKNLLLKSRVISDGNHTTKNIYNYQILFKNYLITKLYETYSKEKINELNSIVLKYYENSNDITSVINFLFKIKDFKAGIPIILENFDKLFNEGKFEYLWSWFTSIDRNIIDKNPYLIFYLGVLYKYFIGDLDSSLEYLQKAIAELKKQKDTGILIRCYINKAGVLLNLGRTHEVVDELTGLLNEQTSQENHSKLLFYLGFAYYQNSKYDISINFLNKALEICIKYDLKNLESRIYVLLGHIHLIKGDYKQSIANYENTSENNQNVLDRFETLCNLTLLSSQSANFRKSKKYIEQLEQIVNNFPTAIFKIPFLLAKQAYLFESGQYEENVKVLSEIASTASSMNHQNYLYLSYRLLSDTYYHMEDFEKAQIYYEYAFALMQKSSENELEKIELAVAKSLIKEKTEPDEDIESILLLAHDYYEKEGLHYSKVQICNHLAEYYIRNNKLKEAIKYFTKCLKESKEREFKSHLLRESSYSERLFKYCLSNKIEEEFINNLKILKSELQN